MKTHWLVILLFAALGITVAIIGYRTQLMATITRVAPATTASAVSASSKKIIVGPDEAACPVMGTVMKKTDMTPMQHNGKTYYVCCKDCQAQFSANPEKSINNPAPLTREMPQ